MKSLIIIVSLFVFSAHFGVNAQDTIPNDQIYYMKDFDLAYKVSDGKLFSGVTQIRKKNGRIAFEMEYDDGVILKQYVYYRRKNKELATKVIYNPEKPWTELTEIRYFSGIEEWTHYDENGKRTLKEQKRNGDLIYSCEYSGRKKHGQEMCLEDDGTKMYIEYVNSKRKK